MGEISVKREGVTPEITAIGIGWGLVESAWNQGLDGIKTFDNIDIAEAIRRVD
jgi:hypothetical protein